MKTYLVRFLRWIKGETKFHDVAAGFIEKPEGISTITVLVNKIGEWGLKTEAVFIEKNDITENIGVFLVDLDMVAKLFPNEEVETFFQLQELLGPKAAKFIVTYKGLNRTIVNTYGHSSPLILVKPTTS